MAPWTTTAATKTNNHLANGGPKTAPRWALLKPATRHAIRKGNKVVGVGINEGDIVKVILDDNTERIGTVDDTDGHWASIKFADGTYIDRSIRSILKVSAKEG